MANIGMMLLVVVMALLGGFSSLYIMVTMPIIIARKIHGKIKYGKSLYD